MKKVLSLLTICLLVACNNVNKEELKKEIISELNSSNIQPFVIKGNGENYYAEPMALASTSSYYIQHSTIRCPAIKNGVQRNVYKINGYNNTFCSICMNDFLITKFNESFFPNGYKKE